MTSAARDGARRPELRTISSPSWAATSSELQTATSFRPGCRASPRTKAKRRVASTRWASTTKWPTFTGIGRTKETDSPTETTRRPTAV